MTLKLKFNLPFTILVSLKREELKRIVLLIVSSWFSNPSHNLNVRTLFRWIFLVAKSGLLYHIHNTLLMACYGSIKSLSYLRTPLCMYQVHTYANYPNVNIYTTEHLHVLHQVLVLHVDFTNFRFKKRSFISSSLM